MIRYALLSQGTIAHGVGFEPQPFAGASSKEVAVPLHHWTNLLLGEQATTGRMSINSRRNGSLHYPANLVAYDLRRLNRQEVSDLYQKRPKGRRMPQLAASTNASICGFWMTRAFLLRNATLHDVSKNCKWKTGGVNSFF